MKARIQVVPHDPGWRVQFEVEADRIARAVPTVVIRLHHIGSTAIPGIAAKPIIDVLMEAVDLPALDERTPEIQALGYEAMGEYGIPGRRYFRRNDAFGIRTHQMHAFAAGSPEVDRHLAFRDYLVAHPVVAHAYGALKQQLAQQHPDDLEAYMDGKDAFVKDHQMRALLWCAAR